MRMRATQSTRRARRARLISQLSSDIPPTRPRPREPPNRSYNGQGGAFSHCAQVVLNATVSLLLINRKLKTTNFPLVRGVLCESTPLS